MGRSNQSKHGGGSFKSESQRRYFWAVDKKLARKAAHNKPTKKADWRKVRHDPPNKAK